MSPIENAMEIIEDRVHKTKAELETPQPNTKTLQIILQGSVLLRKILSTHKHLFGPF